MLTPRKSRCGATCALAISPLAPFQWVEPFLDQINLLLVMTINPGFGGQSFIHKMMTKVARAAEIRTERGLDFHIGVDGGIHSNTAAIGRESRANVGAAGTGVFEAEDAAVWR